LRWRSLAGLDARELFSSRALWLMLALLGPLVGHAFITAAGAYAEMSAGALAQGLDPQDGIAVPTFGAYDLAATFLLPFVAIRLLSAEKSSGALKLLLQSPAGPAAQVAVKALLLATIWLVALVPGAAALLLWRSYGGHLHGPAILALFAGHLLRALLAIAIALLAAAVSDSASTAAILALAFTVGTWALEFVAAGRGGPLERLAAFTPTAALRQFEQGLLRLDTVLVMLAASAGALLLAAAWLRPGARAIRLGVVALATLAAVGLSSRASTSWDVSEDRRSSFDPADEALLRSLPPPVAVTIKLAPEDPRLGDLERSVLLKLRRLVPLEVRREGEGATGLFAKAGSGYGQLTWRVAGREVTSRSTTPRIVLDQLYALAGSSAPVRQAEAFPGYPLAAIPRGAALLFYALFPALCALGFFLVERRPK
jgi:hypothetical protein